MDIKPKFNLDEAGVFRRRILTEKTKKWTIQFIPPIDVKTVNYMHWMDVYDTTTTLGIPKGFLTMAINDLMNEKK